MKFNCRRNREVLDNVLDVYMLTGMDTVLGQPKVRRWIKTLQWWDYISLLSLISVFKM